MLWLLNPQSKDWAAHEGITPRRIRHSIKASGLKGVGVEVGLRT